MAEKRPAHRPSLYRPEYAEKVRDWCKLGATDFEIAQLLGVDYATFRRWVSAHEDLCAAVKVGKEACDERVLRSLYWKAVGWNDAAPDTAAAIFWLKNRRPKEWRDRRELELGDTGIQVVIKKPDGAA